MRPQDPRRLVALTISGPILRPRWHSQPFTVAAWGCSHNYQLGTGQYTAQASPKIVTTFEGLEDPVCDLACGADHCALARFAFRRPGH